MELSIELRFEAFKILVTQHPGSLIHHHQSSSSSTTRHLPVLHSHGQIGITVARRCSRLARFKKERQPTQNAEKKQNNILPDH